MKKGVAACVVCLLVGLLAGFLIGSYDKKATKRAAAEKAVRMQQMDRFAAGKTVYLETNGRGDTCAAAAASAFVAHGARYGGKDADFVFAADSKKKLGFSTLTIKGARGNVLYATDISLDSSERARHEGLMFLEILARGGSVASRLAQKN